MGETPNWVGFPTRRRQALGDGYTTLATGLPSIPRAIPQPFPGKSWVLDAVYDKKLKNHESTRSFP